MTKKEECYEFQKYIAEFLNNYLINQRGLSQHTQKSYRQTLIAFIKFVANSKGVSFDKISFSDIDQALTVSFLDEYENRGCTISTRNQRRAAIASFFKYSAMTDPTKCYQCQLIRSIPNKRGPKNMEKPVLTMEQVKLLIEQAEMNLNPRLKIRDSLFMRMLYEWGLRITEITSLTVGSLNLWSRTPYITVYGKGAKYRYINITRDSVALIMAYANWFGLDLRKDTDIPLFFTTHKGIRGCMTNENAAKFIKKYADQARKIDPTIPEQVHPHLFRHSRATGLLEQGVPVAYISKFLGHEHYSTTERYLRIDPKTIQTTIENCAIRDNERYGNVFNPAPFKLSDEDEIARLYGISE